MNTVQTKERILQDIWKSSRKMSDVKPNRNTGRHTTYRAVSVRKVAEILDKYL